MHFCTISIHCYNTIVTTFKAFLVYCNMMEIFILFCPYACLQTFLSSILIPQNISSFSLLSDLITYNVFQQHFIKYNIKFKTMLTYFPWSSDAWERLIKIMKSCIYRAIGRKTITYFKFLTTFQTFSWH